MEDTDRQRRGNRGSARFGRRDAFRSRPKPDRRFRSSNKQSREFTPPPGWSFDPAPVRLISSTDDDDAHGTHVAGIVGARGIPGYGVAGVVWNCKSLPIRCMARIVNQEGQSTNIGHPDDIANAIVWAADHGARVLNLSLGYPGISTGYSIEGDCA